jgi:hypothetical protein
MGRLPPAEKLSLAVRKNVRDEWDSSKQDFEQQLSTLLGQPWTIEVNPNAIWPYHNDGYAKDSLGSCIKSYVDSAIYQIKYLSGRYDSLAQEINDICSAHVLTLDVDEVSPARFSYCGGDVVDGKLTMVFNEKCLGTNINDCLNEGNLFSALNKAPSDKPLSFSARIGIRSEYDPSIEKPRQELAEMVGKTADKITFNPNFEETFAKLTEAAKVKGSDLRDDWQSVLGSFTFKYFEALVYHMKYIKVGDDELVQEGFLEAVPKLEFVFRIVDKLKDSGSSYNEVVIEDEKLYLQCPAQKWGVNIDYVASKLMDLL